MYFPPYEQLVAAASRLTVGKGSEPSVTIPKRLLDFLLQAALTTAEFDEENYLNKNPDIRDSLANSNVLTAHEHFIKYGYFEGRRGGGTQVDEAWYLQQNPDVADGVRMGAVQSAAEHFEVVGACEGRAPSKLYVDAAAQWKKLLVKV